MPFKAMMKFTPKYGCMTDTPVEETLTGAFNVVPEPVLAVVPLTVVFTPPKLTGLLALAA